VDSEEIGRECGRALILIRGDTANSETQSFSGTERHAMYEKNDFAYNSNWDRCGKTFAETIERRTENHVWLVGGWTSKGNTPPVHGQSANSLEIRLAPEAEKRGTGPGAGLGTVENTGFSPDRSRLPTQSGEWSAAAKFKSVLSRTEVAIMGRYGSSNPLLSMKLGALRGLQLKSRSCVEKNAPAVGSACRKVPPWSQKNRGAFLRRGARQHRGKGLDGIIRHISKLSKMGCA